MSRPPQTCDSGIPRAIRAALADCDTIRGMPGNPGGRFADAVTQELLATQERLLHETDRLVQQTKSLHDHPEDIEGHRKLMDEFVEHNKALIEHSKAIKQRARDVIDVHKSRPRRPKRADSE